MTGTPAVRQQYGSSTPQRVSSLSRLFKNSKLSLSCHQMHLSQRSSMMLCKICLLAVVLKVQRFRCGGWIMPSSVTAMQTTQASSLQTHTRRQMRWQLPLWPSLVHCCSELLVSLTCVLNTFGPRGTGRSLTLHNKIM